MRQADLRLAILAAALVADLAGLSGLAPLTRAMPLAGVDFFAGVA